MLPKPVKSNRNTANPLATKALAILLAAAISFPQVKQ
ncbi:hypothetical protein lpg0164 [Legionella pneumophila subsp. pneumophila str. Philadelphia 1]|uniref:Uncharacterized protein n=1 Tax=Legionella pneumophila subsp. pneumophila (strain Philadelphia 1 / ATCC 33152 / DSM 7513) TaxID=272624 RepID=Q5ZZ47_LEGPH|nr:hypothetical protein lpg0164 [Legionella pneumophila subsp. pneumophila str. Philadelphia 1]AEW50453.1 hypothetical protein lp12_0166 [Legionella pneumophila subsp. pneumophila ATCC 43290]